MTIRRGFAFGLHPKTHLRTLVVRFEHALLYTSSDEGARLTALKNDRLMAFPHVFWKVENSALPTERHQQSCAIYASSAITHCAFLSSCAGINVLIAAAPSFEGHDDR